MDRNDDQGRPEVPLTAGNRLRSAREASGLSRSDIASRTKIAERHLLAIEEDRFGDLAARTYAVGFARAYARALGLDEREIAAVVRAQLEADVPDRPDMAQSFEPGDPARVPPVRVAWLAAGAAVVVIALLLVFWSSYLSPEGELPDLLPEGTPTTVASAVPSARPAAAPALAPVVLTALADGVWLSISDGAGTRLLEKTLAKGESWTVPANAQAPQLRTGRPDALQLSIGGKALPPLADRPTTMSGVSLVAADLLARTDAAPAASAPAAPVPAASAVPTTVQPAAGPVTGAAAPVSPPTGAAPGRPAGRPVPAPRPRPVATATAPAPAPPPPASAPAAAPSTAPATEPVSTVSE